MRGGYRPNSGPKKGTKYKKKSAESKKQIIDKGGGKIGSETPLEYMLRVMNDPNESEERRARMAQAAAPYVHKRQGEGMGKKEEAEELAKKALSGKFAPGRPPLKVVK